MSILTPAVRDLINLTQEAIDHNQWEAVYDVLFAECINFVDIGRFTECMLTAGLNPLDYCKDIPEAYLYMTNITEIIIPDHIRSVREWAYADCHKIDKIILPKSVTFLEDNCFAYCDDILELIIENPRIGIDLFSFYDSRVHTVRYNGTIEEWKQNGYKIEARRIICTNGEL